MEEDLPARSEDRPLVPGLWALDFSRGDYISRICHFGVGDYPDWRLTTLCLWAGLIATLPGTGLSVGFKPQSFSGHQCKGSLLGVQGRFLIGAFPLQLVAVTDPVTVHYSPCSERLSIGMRFREEEGHFAHLGITNGRGYWYAAGVTYWPWNEAGFFQGPFANSPYLSEQGLLYLQSGSRRQFLTPMDKMEWSEKEEELQEGEQ
jgi:hypothetical protein